MPLWLTALLGFLPVVVFLATLLALDGYALVPPRKLLPALAGGAAAAGIAWRSPSPG
jgi:hypothetical protein